MRCFDGFVKGDELHVAHTLGMLKSSLDKVTVQPIIVSRPQLCQYYLHLVRQIELFVVAIVCGWIASALFIGRKSISWRT